MINWLKRIIIGAPRNPHDRSMVHKISLVAFFAWVGLGADGLSSSCYGPQEAYIVLGGHIFLGVFIALASALTVFIISASYSQIIELFPNGGGGYLVASRLISPFWGMFSGCALLIDYVLTISISIASGADAVFSFLPPEYFPWRLLFALLVLMAMIVLNMRGVKESIIILMPIFLLFVISHVLMILAAFSFHFSNFPVLVQTSAAELQKTSSSLGIVGLLLLLVRAYSMGAGTYTGIEAVSNGTPILREPRAQTAKKTMLYMATSLAFMVLGITLAYVFYQLSLEPGKTMNAVLFARVTQGLDPMIANLAVVITLISEAAILVVAAQAGFIDGPRVLSNMALDGWMPKRFSLLSDRLVTFNGILIMGISSILLMMLTRGSVALLVVLYSINVFITFFLSQLGMVKHWWQNREGAEAWFGKLLINGTGLLLTTVILTSVSFVKFHEGGWVTFVITGSLVCFSITIKRNYRKMEEEITELDRQILGLEPPSPDYIPKLEDLTGFDPQAKTAVVLVKDFTSIGLQTISTILHSFKGVFKNFVFVQIGLINAGNLVEVEAVKRKIRGQVDQYVSFMRNFGYHAEGFCLAGIDTTEEFSKTVPEILEKYPDSVFFGGQLVFFNDSWFNRLLHNYTLFSIQRRLYLEGKSLFIIPIRVR